jgi:hypothetical protein
MQDALKTCLMAGLLIMAMVAIMGWRQRDERQSIAITSVLCGAGMFILTVVFTAAIGAAHLTPTHWELQSSYTLNQINVNGQLAYYSIYLDFDDYDAEGAMVGYLVYPTDYPEWRALQVSDDDVVTYTTTDDSSPRIERWVKKPSGWWSWLGLGGRTSNYYIYTPKS